MIFSSMSWWFVFLFFASRHARYGRARLEILCIREDAHFNNRSHLTKYLHFNPDVGFKKKKNLSADRGCTPRSFLFGGQTKIQKGKIAGNLIQLQAYFLLLIITLIVSEPSKGVPLVSSPVIVNSTSLLIVLK